ncbi:hypothetical protein [Sphingomonas sp. 2SG]|nr:hypothetical protein [Sphingomonas sp. 2SG]
MSLPPTSGTGRETIHYVDLQTLQRTPTLGATWYEEVVRRNPIV